MPNTLVVALSQNKETFKDCRLYLLGICKTKEKVLELENANVNNVLLYYLSYLETKGIIINEAINYFALDNISLSYWELLKVTIVNSFRKIENNDYNFIPY